jgi:hypothetical protein
MSEGRFAGVDWASEEHAVCVVDERGRIVEGCRYRRNERGIRALCARLVRCTVVPALLMDRQRRPDLARSFPAPACRGGAAPLCSHAGVADRRPPQTAPRAH